MKPIIKKIGDKWEVWNTNRIGLYPLKFDTWIEAIVEVEFHYWYKRYYARKTSKL